MCRFQCFTTYIVGCLYRCANRSILEAKNVYNLLAVLYYTNKEEVGLWPLSLNSSHVVDFFLHFQVMCKLYYFVQAMSYAASIMILTVISIERYFAIIHPMRSKQFTTLCLLRVVVVIVWTVAAGCAVPYLVIYDTVNLQGMEFCLMIGHFDNKSYVTISFILWYLIPLCLMTIMYTKISVVLWKTSNIENLEKNNSFKQKKSSNKKRRKSPGDLKHALFGRKKADHKNSMLSKTTIYISGVSTPGSSDETTQEESRVSYVQNPVTETYDQRLLQSAPPGCRSTEISGEEGEVEEHSSDEATDFEDDWPGSQKNNRKQGHHINMKQVYTFRNPTYNGACPVCGASTSKDTRGSPMEKCGCSNSRTPLTPPAGTRGPSSDAPCTVQTRKPTRRNENALLARRRVIRLLIAVIVSFAICVIPYHIRLLWVTWSEPSLSFAESLLPPITFVIFYFNSGLNPILYAFLSDNFRRSLREVLSCSVDESSRLRNMRSTTYVKTMNSSM